MLISLDFLWKYVDYVEFQAFYSNLVTKITFLLQMKEQKNAPFLAVRFLIFQANQTSKVPFSMAVIIATRLS